MAASTSSPRITGPTVGLSRIYARSLILRLCVVLIAATTAIATLGALVIVQMTRTPQQLIAQTVGSFQYSLSLPTNLNPGDSDRLSGIVRAVQAMDQESTWGIAAPEVPLKGATQSQRTQYYGHSWDHQPLPERFVLLEGRWPSSTGELAASRGTGLSPGTETALFGERVNAKIVGVVEDQANRTGRLVVGPRDQWSSWKLPDIAVLYPNTVANVEVYWSSTPRQEAAVALAGLVGGKPSALDQTIAERALMGTARRDIASVLLPITGVAPLLLVPVVSGLAVGLVLGAWNARTRTRLLRIGISRKMIRGALHLSAAYGVILGWLGGTLLGLAASYASRPILALLVPYQLAPWLPVGAYQLQALALCAGGAALGLVSAPGIGASLSLVGALSRVRRPAAGVCALALIVLVPAARRGVDTSLVATVATLLVALLSPDVLRLTALATRTRSMARLLAKRIVHSQGKYAGAALIGLVAIQAMMAMGLSIAITQVDVADAAQKASTPPGRLMVQSLSPMEPVPAPVIERIERDTGLGKPIITWDLAQDDISPLVQGPILIVETTEELERLLGTPLTPTQGATTRNGILLLSETSATSAELRLKSGLVTVPATHISAPRELDAGGIALASAPFAQGESNRTMQTLYYVAPQDDIVRVAPGLAERIGVDPGYIRYHKAPIPYEISTSVGLALAGFGLMATLLFTGFVGAVGRQIRPYLASLMSLGVPRSWKVALTFWIIAPFLLCATLLSLVAVGFGTLLIWIAQPEAFRLHIPAPSLLAIAITTLSGAVSGGFITMARLSVRERHLHS